MALPNIFTKSVADKVIERINALEPTTKAQWGKMSAAQTLAHCNVIYEIAFENNHKKPNFIMGFILKTFVKNVVVSEIPYKKNSQTSPELIIKETKDLQAEKNRIINYLYKTVELGEESFNNKESLSFGKLTKIEWNNLFYKHLDHHLSQFGV